MGFSESTAERSCTSISDEGQNFVKLCHLLMEMGFVSQPQGLSPALEIVGISRAWIDEGKTEIRETGTKMNLISNRPVQA